MSILRSVKFTRPIVGYARNFVLNTPREFDGKLVNSTQYLYNSLPSSRALAAQATAQHEYSLEQRLRNIDNDVRRSGRISRKDVDDVLEDIRLSNTPTSTQSLLVIRCCGNLVPEELPEVRTKLVQEIWNTLIKLNVPMDISHYNALLRVYLENEHQFAPTELLAEIESKGLVPNRVTYQRLISRYCQIGNIEGATKILEYMREKQLAVNENVFNALINGHSQSGDMPSAQGILTVMSQAGLQPTTDTYTTLLCGYARTGDVDKIKEILTECEQKELHFLDKDYLDVIYAMAITDHSQYVPMILEKVQRKIGYTQDAINLILRLINKGKTDVAFQVLRTVPRSTQEDGTLMPIGTFFVKQMVKTNRPVDEITKYCKMLAEEEMYKQGMMLATIVCLETQIESQNENLAYQLFDKLKEENKPIRQHYFWPLLVSKASDTTGNGIISVLAKMADYNLTPSTETIRDYVIPNIKGKSSDIIQKLREANISIAASVCSLVQSLLLRRDLEEAAIIISKVPAYYYPDLLRRPLASALYATKNYDAFVTVARHIIENSTRLELVQKDDKLPTIDKVQILGSLILELATFKDFPEIVDGVLEKLVEQGLSLATITAEKIQEKLGEGITTTTSDLLGKLTSGELTPVPMTKSRSPKYTPSNQMNISQLEYLIRNLNAKKQDTKGLQRQLLNLYCRAKELEKLDALLKELEQTTDFAFSAGIYAQVMDAYAYENKIDEAKSYYKKIKEFDPSTPIDDTKLIRYIGCLIKNDHYNEALEVLSEHSKNRRQSDKTFLHNSECWKVLNHLAEQGKVEELNVLFNIMVKEDFVAVNNVLLGPLVKVHFVNKDLDKALDAFEWCCKQFQVTPWKSELTARLIQSEDAEKLQRITDLSTSVHGEINSLYDLVFAFVECGRVRQARKILETPGLQNRPHKINIACERYQAEGNVKPLEGLKDATKDLNHIDRSDIYQQLLLCYIKQDDPDKALGLWTQMQEEDLLPTEKFLVTLGEYLKAKDIDVPFNIPKIRTTTVQPTERKVFKKDIVGLRQSLSADDIDTALSIKQKTKDQIPAIDLSILLEKLLQKGRTDDAKKLCLEMLNKNTAPIIRVFRFFLNKIANAGDLETLNVIGTKIDHELKKMVSFDNRICNANLIAGNASVYLDGLEREIDNAKDENLEHISEKFPRGGVVGILEKHPELTEQYEQIADKYSKRGLIAPYNVLWSQYFIKGEYEKAENIWQKYLQGAPRIMFQRVVQAARESKDEKLIKKLIEHLQTSKVTEGALGNAYSCLLDVLVAQRNKQEIVQTFEKAISEISIDSINRTAVLRVKETYESLGKSFNYKIPAKTKSAITVTTSSEEDARQ